MLPALLVAAAVAITGKAVKDGIDGKRMSDEAERLERRARRRHNEAMENMEECVKGTEEKLSDLGTLQIKIGESFGTFKELADNLLEKINAAGVSDGKTVEVPIESYKLKRIHGVAISVKEFMGLAAGSSIAAAAAGYAVWGGVMMLGTASTGTAIATLSGVAATNATLAAIGGGSLAAGGLGIAGGTAILGGIVAAPVLAIAGWAYKSKAKDSLEAAEDYEYEVDKLVKKSESIIDKHENIQEYILRVHKELHQLNILFTPFIDKLQKACKMSDAEIERASDSILRDITNGYMLAAILADIISTPLFVMKKDKDKDTGKEIIVPAQDENGVMKPNTSKMNVALKAAQEY